MRDRASDREKFFITMTYGLQVTGNLEKVQGTCEAWGQAYPRELEPKRFLTLMDVVSGRHDQMLDKTISLAELYPDFAVSYYPGPQSRPPGLRC